MKQAMGSAMTIRGGGLLALSAALAFLMLVGMAGPAGAVCASAAEDGLWTNNDPQASGIARVEIVMNCQNMVVNGEPWPPGYAWQVRVFERCGTGLCYWGEVGAMNREKTRHILAVFDRDGVQRRVYLRMAPMSLSYLYAYVYEDFNDPERANTGRHYWFQNPAMHPCSVPMTRHDWKTFLWEWLDCEPKVEGR